MKKILIAGGGTGGHIFPAIAIAEELKNLNFEPVLVGSRWGIEGNIFPKYPFKYYLTHQMGFVGKNFIRKIFSIINFLIAIFEVLVIIFKEKPSAVVGTGGYASFLPVFFLSLMGKPSLITEIDSIPGFVTKFLSRFVREVHVAFPTVKYYLPCRKIRHSGFPIRRSILSSEGETERGSIFILGGSQGSLKLNLIAKDLPKYLPKKFRIIWQKGRFSEKIPEIKDERVEVYEFIDDMGKFLRRAELIVARAGALTIGEIAVLGKPSILIPFPYSARGHQLHNALYYKQLGACEIILEKNLTAPYLAQKIIDMMSSPEKLRRMSHSAKKFGKISTKIIAERIKCFVT